MRRKILTDCPDCKKTLLLDSIELNGDRTVNFICKHCNKTHKNKDGYGTVDLDINPEAEVEIEIDNNAIDGIPGDEKVLAKMSGVIVD